MEKKDQGRGNHARKSSAARAHQGHGGHEHHGSHHAMVVADFRRQFRVSLALTVPILVLSRKMVQNLAWATGYNAVAIPLAAGVLAKWGILLSPAVGAVLMSASTVIVAVNAKLLRVEKEVS